MMAMLETFDITALLLYCSCSMIILNRFKNVGAISQIKMEVSER
jgi:hypothetical protein